MALTLTSTAFEHGGEIPPLYTCDGRDISPPLEWAGVPPNAKSLVLIVDDPDAPDPAAPKRVWVHWVLYNLPPQDGSLPEAAKRDQLPPGTVEGVNDSHRQGYGGPCPPIGRHRYYFKLDALDIVLQSLGAATKAQVEEAMRGHDIESAELDGNLPAVAVIEVVRGDITALDVDAIVNAANTGLRGGGGVDGAIHRAAGPGLLQELLGHPGCPTGSAVLTRGHRLRARFVIHAVGPIWDGGEADEHQLLASAYETAFRLAREEGSIRSLAFPAISTGIYGFPKREAARIALQKMREHESEFDRIVACVFDVESENVYREVVSS